MKARNAKIKAQAAKSLVSHPTQVALTSKEDVLSHRPGREVVQMVEVINTKDDSTAYKGPITSEAPGQVCLVVRPPKKGRDVAIAFVRKYRATLIRNTPENIEWRESGGVMIEEAPQCGDYSIEVTRGWPDKPWDMRSMVEGQEETRLIVEDAAPVTGPDGSPANIHPNTGAVATEVPLLYGVATEKPYKGEVDEQETKEIAGVLWLTPEKIKAFMDNESCSFSLSALARFRMFALRQEPGSMIRNLGEHL